MTRLTLVEGHEVPWQAKTASIEGAEGDVDLEQAVQDQLFVRLSVRRAFVCIRIIDNDDVCV